MRKMFFVLGGLSLLTVGLQSCRKNYVCNCTNGASLPIDNAVKTDATAACAEYRDIVRIGTPSADCKLTAN